MELDLDRARLFMQKTQAFQSITSPCRGSQHYFVLHISHSRPLTDDGDDTDYGYFNLKPQSCYLLGCSLIQKTSHDVIPAVPDTLTPTALY